MKYVFERFLLICSTFLLGYLSAFSQEKRPNILILMSDNQFWHHTGIYGDSSVKTPHIDAVAKHGARFTHAFCAAPSCAPSRAGFLTGQDTWRLEDGADLWGTLPAKFQVYTDLLEQSGYSVGFQGKGWGPGKFEPGGRKRNPAGNEFSAFPAFLQQAKAGRPWTFWFSSHEPHRPYVLGSGVAAGIDPAKVNVPAYLPNTDSVRQDIADYYAAIETFDAEIGTILKTLKASGQYDNTVIVICSDNGWQMPRGLANLYDFGSRVPLIVAYSKWSQQERVLEDFVNLNDLAPTFLNLGKVAIPKSVTAKSLLPTLLAGKAKGLVDKKRTEVFMARERHAFARKSGLGYPGRAIRTKDFLYIHNYEPDRWPAGDPPLYSDVDANNLHYPSLTKVYILSHRKDAADTVFYNLAFAKRPEEELYDLNKDPEQLKNVAYDAAYQSQRRLLSKKLNNYLRRTKDPRILGQKIIWDSVPYYEPKDFTPKPSPENQKALGLDSSYNYLEEK